MKSEDSTSRISRKTGRALRAPSSDPRLLIVRRTWRGFRAWRRSRPFWGGLFCILGGGIIVYGPATVYRFLLVSGGVVWAGLLTGAIVILMGLVLWFAPSQRTLAGLLAVVLSVASLVSANLGGYFIGMFLGIIGGALGFAWAPIRSAAPSGLRERTVMSGEARQPAAATGQPELPPIEVGRDAGRQP